MKRQENNIIIREALKRHSLPQYQLADVLGVSEWTLCRWLRHELPKDQQRDIVAKIEQTTK